MTFLDISPALKAQMPQLRGRLVPNQPLAEFTWFRVGGPAQLLFMPEDEQDLSYLLAHLPAEIPVTVIGLGSNLIVRDGGDNAAATLSEGEKSFVCFLYFYHLLRGSVSESDVTSDCIVVFDDPVSSLDSDVLFIVSTLIKRVLKEACEGTGQIKQVFVLTHNVYFHKEVSFDPNRRTTRKAHETFWIVRKVEGVSKIIGYNYNPIKTSYELLWAEVRNPNRSNMAIQNTLRRIIENYFKILGNVNTDDIIAKFEGKDQQVCVSLFSWVNDGSHSAHDDFYISSDDSVVSRYLEVFHRIFKKTGHLGHYKMMMGPEALADPAQGAVTVALAATA